MLTSRLKLTTDAAWLPYTHFSGVDNHWDRPLTFSEGGSGNGVQLDALLSYDITDRLSLGVGGRYWSFKTTDAHYSAGGPSWGMKANAETYGLLVQGSYKIGSEPEPLK